VLRKVVVAGIVGAVAMSLGTTPAVAGACSTKGLVIPGPAGGYKFVLINAQGISCSKARAVARQVAQQVIHNKSISVPGVVASVAMSTQMCTGCAPTTEISLTYASGDKVTVSLRGPGVGKSTPLPSPLPSPSPHPTPGPGPGVITV
jgi:hypothetical protein